MDVLSSRVLLHPTDPERSRVFYRDTLGLGIYREFGSGPERGTVFFLGGGFLELSGCAAAPPSPAMALWLQVRELAAVRRELGERGVPILREPWGLVELWIADPDGVRICIVEVPAEHPPRLTRTSVSSMACRGGRFHSGRSSPTCRQAMTGWPCGWRTRQPSGDVAAAPGRWNNAHPSAARLVAIEEDP